MNTRILTVAIVLLAASLLATFTTGLKAQPLQQQLTVKQGAKLSDKVSPHKKTDVPPTAQAQGGLIWFTNQAEFEAFNASEGNILKGIEDFEESILPPSTFAGVDDPLQSCVANLPDGYPFPFGLTGLPNLIVQSNILGGNPTIPDPAGAFGLFAMAENGFPGVLSDIIFTNFNNHSFDLIFTEEKSSVGFNTIAFAGAQEVEVRVYSATNVFLGMMVSPADVSGTNFIGVWSPDPIGRINIFDLANGAEGSDNIQAWGAGDPCPADLDGDGNVGTSDLLQLLANWGACP